MIKIKRIYDDKSKGDGYRILIDRLWPRGVKKETSGVDLWLKEVSPSHDLRKWFSHDPERWKAFLKRYEDELESNAEGIEKLSQLADEKNVITLLYSAKNEAYNNAVALLAILAKRKN